MQEAPFRCYIFMKRPAVEFNAYIALESMFDKSQ